MKKLISLFLSTIFVVSVLPLNSISSYAEETILSYEALSEDEYDEEFISIAMQGYEELVEDYKNVNFEEFFENDEYDTVVSKDVLVAYVKMIKFVEECKNEDSEKYYCIKYCIIDYDENAHFCVKVCLSYDDEDVIAKVKTFAEDENVEEFIRISSNPTVLISCSEETSLTCLALDEYFTERKRENSDKYKFFVGCDIDETNDMVKVIFSCSITEGENTIIISELKEYMEENDIDEDRVEFATNGIWYDDYNMDISATDSTETTTETKPLDEVSETSDTDSSTTVEYGDISGDSIVSIGDAVLLNKYLVDTVDLSESAKTSADVNLDGTIDSTDANLVLGYCVQAVESLPYTE